MAVAYDNAANTDGFGVTSLTTSGFTISSATKRCACLAFYLISSTLNSVSTTCGGASGVAISGAGQLNISGFSTQLYKCIAPNSGTQTASATWTGSANGAVSVVTATGVDQTTGMNNGGTSTSAFQTSANLTVTSTTNDLTTTMFGSGGPDTTATSDKNKKTSEWCAQDVGNGGGNTTHTWTDSAQTCYVNGANFIAAAGQFADYAIAWTVC
jgi:hypothetical protein